MTRIERALRDGAMAQPVLLITPKGMRVQQLRAQGKSVDEAFRIADAEYSSDGMQPTPERLATLLDQEPAELFCSWNPEATYQPDESGRNL